MPFIEFRQQLFQLREGENLIGANPQATIRLPDLPGGCELGITVEGSVAVAWATGDGTTASINGRPLEREPVPLFGGDEISLEDSSLVFPLVYIEDANEPTPVMPPREQRAAPAAVAGGVVESADGADAVEHEKLMRRTPPVAEHKVIGVLRRVDNNELFMIDSSGFRIGRERRCELIIPDSSVSRLHAEISLHGDQYVLRDAGRVATKVNGSEIHGAHHLKVGDVIQIGDREFAFLRRTVSAEEILQKGEVTPVRSAVPDAPTVMPGKPTQKTSRAFNYVLLALLLAMLGLIVLG